MPHLQKKNMYKWYIKNTLNILKQQFNQDLPLRPGWEGGGGMYVAAKSHASNEATNNKLHINTYPNA